MSSQKKSGACPICGKPAAPNYRPFCSRRCADIDLGRWLGERYIVTEPVEPELDRAPDRQEDED